MDASSSGSSSTTSFSIAPLTGRVSTRGNGFHELSECLMDGLVHELLGRFDLLR